MKQLLTCLLLCFLSCTSSEQEDLKVINNISILSLGDSYTIGTAINSSGNFPNQLTDSLSTYGYQVDTLDIVAKNGWTTTNLLDGIYNKSIKPNAYDIVTLLIGVNNQYQNKAFSLYENELNALVEKAISFSKKGKDGVVIISIPDYSVTPFVQSSQKHSVSEAIAKYNQFKSTIAASYGIPFINITPISQLAANDLSLIADDQLHPSVEMYSLWVEAMLPEILSIID